ncbi:hypothetical protein VFPFJ_05310 [Purpureocillium lilacinum]|uniref:Uncharacterized protein n=1 Tax=Purpureocillium lilacinum TaxID=33203 RepID=A0A179H4B2_PURLI|nr:hypothetical protein VFPFJ_05310 [Purpureocillium lilacinum]OAQ84361.1 hypothetical protein VFPBJ_03129 [Purpureocillium lilacinum]OAQ91151.1 hypothetical protein VFPFJ_05310 [Purpureocillium lilacinum]
MRITPSTLNRSTAKLFESPVPCAARDAAGPSKAAGLYHHLHLSPYTQAVIRTGLATIRFPP